MGQTTTVFLTSIYKFEPRPHTHICWVSIWRRPSQSLQDTSKFTQQVPAVWWVSGKSLPSSNQRWVLGGQSSSFIKMNTLSQLISDGHMWLAYPKSRLLTSTYRNVARCHQADISHGPVYNPIGRFWAQIPQFFPWTYISFSPFSSTLRMGIQP